MAVHCVLLVPDISSWSVVYPAGEDACHSCALYATRDTYCATLFANMSWFFTHGCRVHCEPQIRTEFGNLWYQSSLWRVHKACCQQKLSSVQRLQQCGQLNRFLISKWCNATNLEHLPHSALLQLLLKHGTDLHCSHPAVR